MALRDKAWSPYAAGIRIDDVAPTSTGWAQARPVADNRHIIPLSSASA